MYTCIVIHTQDMIQFNEIPYNLNKKILFQNNLFRMELDDTDMIQLQKDIAYINGFISNSKRFSELIPPNITFYGSELNFNQNKPCFIQCTPFTSTGKLSKYPVIIHFNCNAYATIGDDSFGELYYTKNGDISKAKVICWRKGFSFAFYFKTINNSLLIWKINFNFPHGRNALIIYKI